MFILLVSGSFGKAQGTQTWPKKSKEICWRASGKFFLADKERHTGRDTAPLFLQEGVLPVWEASLMGWIMANRPRTTEQKDRKTLGYGTMQLPS